MTKGKEVFFVHNVEILSPDAFSPRVLSTMRATPMLARITELRIVKAMKLDGSSADAGTTTALWRTSNYEAGSRP